MQSVTHSPKLKENLLMRDAKKILVYSICFYFNFL